MPTLTQPASRQIVLWVAANVGGVGKTTLAVHIGYRLAQLGYKSLLVDLDTNGSLASFCGLNGNLPPDQTAAILFDGDFDGNYPIQTPSWGKPKGRFDTCLGGDVMLSVALYLPRLTAHEYVLRRALKKFPAPYDILILDSPASLDVLSIAALAACTHIAIPLPMSVKMSGVNTLLEWVRIKSDQLDLNPQPKIFGCVPMRIAKNADQLMYHAEIKPALTKQSVETFQGIRFSVEFENAANRGCAPLFIYRPGHAACRDFDPVCDRLVQELKI